MLRVGTFNVHDLGPRRRDAVEHRRRVHDVVRALDADILMVQEVLGGEDELIALATAAGMECHFRQPTRDEGGGDAGVVALARSGGRPDATYSLGILWRPQRVSPVSASWRTYNGEMWHNLAVLDVLVDDTTRLRTGSYHGPPFGRRQRADEAERVVSAMTRPRGSCPPTIVGADWNSIGADRLLSDRGAEFYHPDPYQDRPWSEAMVYQCDWEIDPVTGQPTRQRADRTPGEILWAAGIRDTAALARSPWCATAGHADDTELDFGPRAIDGHRVNASMAPAVIRHEVVDTPDTRVTSDHLPVITTLDCGRLA